MRTVIAGLIAGVIATLLLIACLGVTPTRAYQSHHVAADTSCAVAVYGTWDVVLEDRTDCGGFLVPVVRWSTSIPGYLACMADVQRPIGYTDEQLWYGGFSLWDTQGDCSSYLSEMPRLVRGRLTDMGREVRRDMIQRLAP